MPLVRVEIVPEPSDGEREALLRLLADLEDDRRDGPAVYRSPWRLAGLLHVA